MLPTISTLRMAGLFTLTVAVLLAGCGAAPGGGTPSSGPDDPFPDGSNVTLPPGLNQSGITNLEKLLTAHRQAMAASGFVYRFDHRLVARLPNNTTRTTIAVSGEVRATANLTMVRTFSDMDAPENTTVSEWTNGTTGYRRVVATNTTYERIAPTHSLGITSHYMLQNLLSRDGWNLSNVAANGSRFYFVSDDRQPVRSGRKVSDNLKGRLVVDKQGRIRRLTVTFQDSEYVDELNGSIHYTRTFVYRVSTVGNVSISQPAWVDTARNATRE